MAKQYIKGHRWRVHFHVDVYLSEFLGDSSVMVWSRSIEQIQQNPQMERVIQIKHTSHFQVWNSTHLSGVQIVISSTGLPPARKELKLKLITFIYYTSLLYRYLLQFCPLKANWHNNHIISVNFLYRIAAGFKKISSCQNSILLFVYTYFQIH